MNRILITTGNGMFGKALAKELINNKNIIVRLMVRDSNKVELKSDNIEIVTADMDQPDSLQRTLQNVDSVYLSSPMHPNLAEREINIIHQAKVAGIKKIVKIYGSVKHEGDKLDQMHCKVIDYLKNSDINWTLVSPNSVMETSLASYQPSIAYMHAIYGISGNAKIGLVALKDVAVVSAHVLTTEGHSNMNYELTGPKAINMFEVAQAFSNVLNKKIFYIDLTEEQLTKMLMKYDKSTTLQKLELEVLCHLRAWKKGNANLETDTFRMLMNKQPTSIEEYIKDNIAYYSKGLLPSPIAWLIRKTQIF